MLEVCDRTEANHLIHLRNTQLGETIRSLSCLYPWGQQEGGPTRKVAPGVYGIEHTYRMGTMQSNSIEYKVDHAEKLKFIAALI